MEEEEETTHEWRKRGEPLMSGARGRELLMSEGRGGEPIMSEGRGEGLLISEGMGGSISWVDRQKRLS